MYLYLVDATHVKILEPKFTSRSLVQVTRLDTKNWQRTRNGVSCSFVTVFVPMVPLKACSYDAIVTAIFGAYMGCTGFSVNV